MIINKKIPIKLDQRDRSGNLVGRGMPKRSKFSVTFKCLYQLIQTNCF